MSDPSGLTVAVTGPTGTFGLALARLLEADDAVARVVGIARRPFDPAERGWTKMEYRQGDVRDPDAWRALQEDLLPALLASLPADAPVRQVQVNRDSGTLAELTEAR